MSVNDELAALLLKLADEIERNRVVVGQHISVSAGPGASGTIIGQKVEVHGGPGMQGGTIIGNKVSVSVGGSTAPVQADDAKIVSALRQLAPEVRTGKASKSFIRWVLDGAGKLASAGFTAATRVGIEKLFQHYAGT